MEKLILIFPFIQSTRFWALVIMGLSILFYSYGWIPEELRNFITTICGGHIGIRTIDRLSE